MNDLKDTFMSKLSSFKFLFLFSLVVLFLAYFVANYIYQFLNSIVTSFIDVAGSESGGLHLALSPNNLFVQSPYPLYYAAFYFIVIFGLIRFMIAMKINYRSLNKGQHGTSEFATVQELKKQYKIIPGKDAEYEGSGGTIVSALQEKGKKYRLLIDDGPIHTMVIGITRSGKGETYVVPTIDVLSRATDKPSIVVNDPKGELAAASYETLKKRGYDVYVFNLIQQHMSMGFNPLQLVIDAFKSENISLAQQYANSVAHSLYHDPNSKDPFWANSAKSLVTAIILALSFDAIKKGSEEKINMYSVANFLSTMGSDNDEEGNNALDLFFKNRANNDPARLMYATSNFAAGNTRASIFSTAMDKLQIFTLEPNAKLTSFNSLPLTEVGFGEKPIAIFMATPDYDSSNHVLASIFISQLYRVNAEKATLSPNGKMNRHVHFLLDEFGNMPTVEGMAAMVTVGAGRGFRFHLIVQAYSQLKSAYGDESDTIIGNCSNQVYILTKDKETANEFSSLIGTKTIVDISRSGKMFSMDKSETESTKERPLLMPDELMQLEEGHSVVVRANKRQDKKRRKIVPKPIYNHKQTNTNAKFRWEYLADSFDTAKSLQLLPINSDEYAKLTLQDVVFLTNTRQDLYLPLEDVLASADFNALYQRLRKLAMNMDDNLPSFEVMSQWSILQFLSYLMYESLISNELLGKVIVLLKSYMQPDMYEKWATKLLHERVIKFKEPEWPNPMESKTDDFKAPDVEPIMTEDIQNKDQIKGEEMLPIDMEESEEEKWRRLALAGESE